MVTKVPAESVMKANIDEILMSNPQSPAAVEERVLAALDAETQQKSKYLHTCPVGRTPAVMLGWINGYDRFARDLQRFAPVADWLTRQAFHKRANAWISCYETTAPPGVPSLKCTRAWFTH